MPASLLAGAHLGYNAAVMSVNAEKLINDIAARVARRVAAPASEALPKSYVLVALSGDGRGLDEALDRLAR